MVRLNEAYPDNVTSLPEMITAEEEDAALAREQFEYDQRLESLADAKVLEDHYRKFSTPG